MHLSKPLLAASLALVLASPSIARADDPPPAPQPMAPVAAPAYGYYYAPSPLPAPRVRRSTGAMVVGIVLASVGAAAAVIGTGALLGHDNGRDACMSANDTLISVGMSPNDCENHSSKAPAYALMIGGIAGAALGIPLAVYGGQKVPMTTARVTVTPTQGGATAGVVLRF